MLFSVLSREVSAPKSGVKGKAAMCRFSFWDCMAKVIGGCICLSGWVVLAMFLGFKDTVCMGQPRGG